jgi:hypothetical protein
MNPKFDEQNFNLWKQDSEKVWKAYGKRIKIINSKLNTTKTILSIIAILYLLLTIFIIYSLSVRAEITDISETTCKPFTIKIIHELSLSDDMKNYLNQKWSEIKEEIDK